jgi:two-component system, LytTR family, response regulator
MKSSVTQIFPAISESALRTKNANTIPVYQFGEVLWVKAYDITHLQGEGNYTFICTRSGKRYLVSKTMKTVQDMLQVEFLRVHKSYLVNPYHVRSRWLDSIQLSCGKNIPIARRRIRETNEMLAAL